MLTLIIQIVFVLVVILLIQFLGRYFLMTYKLTDKGIKIMGFFTLVFISYDDIDDVTIFPSEEALKLFSSPDVLRLGNRFMGSGILIKRKSGILKKVFISPKNPEEFVLNMKRHITL